MIKVTMKDTHMMILEILKIMKSVCEENHITYYIHAGTVLGAVRHNGFIPWDEDADIMMPIISYDLFIGKLKEKLPDKYDLIYMDGMSSSLQAKVILKDHSEVLCVDIFPMIGITNNPKEQEKFVKKCTNIRNKLRNKNRCKSIKHPNIIKMIMKFVGNLYYSNISYDSIYKEFNKLLYMYDFHESEYVTNPCGGYGIKNVMRKSVYGTPVMHKFEDTEFPIPEKYDEYLKKYYGNYMNLPSIEIQEKGKNRVIEID